MTTATSQRQPDRTGQTVAVIDRGTGSGLETAHQARAESADMTLTGRNPDRLERIRAYLPDQERPCDGHGHLPAVR
jgi:short-subunit dehydrogenase involved in D-alanine esterification of teichoic acids